MRSVCCVSTTVSPTKIVKVASVVGMSDANMLNSSGPNALRCGTPAVMVFVSEIVELIPTAKIRFSRKEKVIAFR